MPEPGNRVPFLRTRAFGVALLLFNGAIATAAWYYLRSVRAGAPADDSTVIGGAAAVLASVFVAMWALRVAGLASLLDTAQRSRRNFLLAFVALAPFVAVPYLARDIRPEPVEYRTPSGERSTHTNFQETEGRYYVTYNETLRVEITREEYEKQSRPIYLALIGGFTTFSLIAVFLAWALIWWPREAAPDAAAR